MSEAGVFVTCAGCGAKARVAKDFKHKEDCKKKSLSPPTCEHTS